MVKNKLKKHNFIKQEDTFTWVMPIIHTENTFIIGGAGITATASNTVYMDNLSVQNEAKITGMMVYNNETNRVEFYDSVSDTWAPIPTKFKLKYLNPFYWIKLFINK